MKKYPEYKNLDLSQIGKDILNYWEENGIFEKSISNREGNPAFTFYEGPPSANGLPGIHHVISRAIKDVFCRYKTLKGFQVKRKAGWDAHGLPVELNVENSLGITKEDIGKKISIEEYNRECKMAVMKYKDAWDELTKKIGFWLNLKDPYITYDNNYIESVWHLLKKFYEKGLLYKGYSVQPYSPAAGTGLSTHELNLPGCYRNIKDVSITAQFKVVRDEKSKKLFESDDENVYFLAWTTTPWTLPSNCALAVGKEIKYAKIKTVNQYSKKVVTVVLAKPLLTKYFPETGEWLSDEGLKEISSMKYLDEYWQKKVDDYFLGKTKTPPHQQLIAHFDISKQELKTNQEKIEYQNFFNGSELEGIHYEQLMPYVKPKGDAFRVILGDFVSIEEGTGIVHTASVFGADDFRVCQKNKVPSILVKDEDGNDMPLVDKQGRFVKEVTDFAGKYVRAEYENPETLKEQNYKPTDVLIAIKLKEENKAFTIGKHEHSYPHCWRTDKPILYYPLDSWFIKTTSAKEKLLKLNNTINWKPEATGTGRFGNWLENIQDWNLSRSRFWGTPLPIWMDLSTKDKICVGSVNDLLGCTDESGNFCQGYICDPSFDTFLNDLKYGNQEVLQELDKEITKKLPHITQQARNTFIQAIQLNKISALVNIPDSVFKKYCRAITPEDLKDLDLHRPFIDNVYFVWWDHGGHRYIYEREPDLIDVWFDSGAMPYAQWHYPIENKETFSQNFPADFIAEGVDQTRGWFFTLHVLAAMLFDSVAFKNVVAHGLVLDKDGNKMSKRLGNAADPFEIIEKYGADATRWYMLTNAQPWDNLKFDEKGIEEVRRKFFGTLYNTYAFFALYANIDGFAYEEEEIPVAERPEIDRWILSRLNSLIKEVVQQYDDYEPTKAGRAIQQFTDDHLSNWYVRLTRRRFWKGGYTQDKIAAYQTLYDCLVTVAKLSSPIAPFFSDRLFTDLNRVANKDNADSVHLTDFPGFDHSLIDKNLEERMQIAQNISSMVLSLRKKEGIKVRQPLNKIKVPALGHQFKSQLEAVKDLILSEINVKEIEYLTTGLQNDSDVIVKTIKPNFKILGPKHGKKMKDIAEAISRLSNEDIETIETGNAYKLVVNGQKITLTLDDVEITSKDIPGWLVSNRGTLIVALDITITEKLREEGIARDLVSKIQHLRKENNFEVTDKILIKIKSDKAINSAINNNLKYICSETLASSLKIVDIINSDEGVLTEVSDGITAFIAIKKLKQIIKT